jgi:hypothetical protein
MHADGLVEQALFHLRMQNAESDAEQSVDQSLFSISVQATSLRQQVRLVVIPLSIPEGVRERQQLLRVFGTIRPMLS